MAQNRVRERSEIAAQLVGYASQARYATRANFLFDGIAFSDSTVLEVGCGTGAWVIWAAINGAKQAIGIEPESDGSTSQTLETLRQTVNALGLNETVLAYDYFLHQLPMEEGKYDTVILYNVINHLNEQAVVDLHENQESFSQFLNIATDLHRRMKPGGTIIIADCGRTNFWDCIGLSSPFAKNIEWAKHQDPVVWSRVFVSAGFRLLDIRWSPLQPFTNITANRFVQYLTCSHFVLRLNA
ncbi:MAG: hypothetical protein NPIRA01_17080 [Nitrospirales bacterium]|nr:MAG: hypothetical protein NPIRA01_17080 [Nitrospirales bacterium]